jgi:AraC-like DNA-binding protein
MTDMLCRVRAGIERLAAGHDRPRHRHLEPYAILVLRGGFAQTSYAGRVRVGVGDLLVQPPLDCHANRLLSPGAEILRLPWPDVTDLGGVYPLPDPDAVARAAARDPHAAAELARSQVATRARFGRPANDAANHAANHAANDLPDLLAAALVAGTVPSLAAWAERAGVARETVARAFAAAYGVPARRFRAELRARAAWLAIVRTRDRLAAIAAATGFADQAHMTREIRTLTGASPAAGRRDLEQLGGAIRASSLRDSRR